MAYTPIYDNTGQPQGISDGARSIPRDQGNRHYRVFREWLQGRGQTEPEWLAANPYVPPTPTQDEVDSEDEKTQLRNIRDTVDLDNMTANQKDKALKFLLKREFRRVQ